MKVNFVPFVIVGILFLLALMFSFTPWAVNGFPTWGWGAIIWVCIMAYGPVADAIVWWLYREEREAEIAAQTAIIDGHLARIEKTHGPKGRQRAIQLAMKEQSEGLEGLEELEIAFLCETEDKRFAQLAIKRINGKLTRDEFVEFQDFFKRKAA